MGWLYKRGYSKQDIIDDVTRFQEDESGTWKTVTKCVFGNVLWAVVEVTAKVDGTCRLDAGQSLRFIALYRLGKETGFGWGYKDECESMGPNYYNCPLTYLNMTPEQCPEWRAKVHAWHAMQKDRTTWKAGDQVIYKGDYFQPYTLVAPYRKHSQARRSGWLIRDKHGVNWRLSSHQLKDVERVAYNDHARSFDVPEPEQVGLL